MFHERYVFCGCPSAATTWLYRRKLHNVENGMTGLMEPGEVHSVVGKKKPSYFVTLFLEPRQMIRYCEEAGVSTLPHFGAAVANDPELIKGLTRLSREWTSGGELLQLQSQLAMLLERAMPYLESPRQSLKRDRPCSNANIGRAQEILRERYNERISLDELAAAAAMSRFHLVRSFTKEFGLSPHAFQLQVRVKKACTLLREGMNCVQAASAVGFADQSHFLRHFRKTMRVTPSQYARPITAPSLRDDANMLLVRL